MRLCLIGHPVKHSLSPPMHRAAFLYFGIAGSYELIDIEPESLPLRMQDLTGHYSGFNVTIPHKEAVFLLLSQHTREANLVGAVNTVRLDSSGAVLAHNTDMQGFMQAFSQGIQTKLNASAVDFISRARSPSALILGAGGAARACLAGLALLGFKKVYLAARRREAALPLLESMNQSISAYLQTSFHAEFIAMSQLGDLDELSTAVNCTSLGLAAEDEIPEWAPILFSRIASSGFFFDTVYRKDQKPTLLMKQAANSQIAAADGLGMLIEQAALAFEYWTGRLPSVELLSNSIAAFTV